jgi:hypothetical protein
VTHYLQAQEKRRMEGYQVTTSWPEGRYT